MQKNALTETNTVCINLPQGKKVMSFNTTNHYLRNILNCMFMMKKVQNKRKVNLTEK